MSPLTLLALALAPGIAIVVYIYLKDRHEKEPIGLLVWAFFLGVGSTVLAIVLETMAENFGFQQGGSSLNNFIFAFGIIGFSEELSKLLCVLLFLFPHKEFNEPFDGIVYSVLVSMGFASLENILYVMEGGSGTAIVRMFSAVPAHATFGIIMGYYIGKAKFEHQHKWRFILIGLVGAVIFHGAYDFFLFNQNNTGIVGGAVVSLFVAIYLSRKAIALHLDRSPFR